MDDSDSASAADDDVIVLNPFEVVTDQDKGYRATNSVSGTRLNTPIKDTPMPIEVITRRFLEDTGATDLRSALKYSAGVVLQSQNDLSNSGANAYQGPGGVNNPEGATANPNAVQVKLRGFVTDNALREGFIRQNSTDAVNIERVEVVRGPAALFYGIGNFGGVVNYLVKRPQAEVGYGFDVSVGSHNFLRGQFDATGPLTADGQLAYRVTGAVQSMEDHTDHFSEDHTFVSPSFLWKPFEGTELLIDGEYGEQDLNGIGARQVRSVADVGVNNDQNEQGGLYTPPGADPRAYRLTGPDTHLNSEASNFQVKLTQRLLEGVTLLAGYNFSTYDADLRDVSAQLFTNVGPSSLWQTIDLRPLAPDRGAGSLNIQDGLVPNSILQYTWFNAINENTRHQFRVELTAQKNLFEGSKWFRIENSILAGYSDLTHELDSRNFGTVPNAFNYRAPNDLSPLRFGTQGDGSPDQDLFQTGEGYSEAQNKAFYASYQGKFLDNRLLVLLGVRRDTNDALDRTTGWLSPGATPTTSETEGETQKETTYQTGLSFRVTPELSLYALKSEGLQPNFSGQLLPDTGAPAGASKAESEEFGLKFDFFEGRVSGTISRYKITKTGFVGAPWYSTVTLGNPRFDPTRDIVYNVSNFTPTQAPGGSNGGSDKLDTGAAWAAWQAGVYSGAIFQSDQGNGTQTWYVNASQSDGAAYLDAAFAANDADNGAAWPGFLYQGESGDSLVNNATMDTMAFHGNGSDRAALLLTDESEGWDSQILIKATDSLEFVVNAAVTEVQRLNFGQWMAYPYREDRWAVWNFNNGSWGTLGLPCSEVYGDPGSGTLGPATETRTSAGQAAGDDTPKYHYDFWANYRFDEGFLKGLTVGLGAYWESKRQYMSGVSHGSGQLILDGAGELLVLYTPERYNIDAMVRYDWRDSRERSHSLQLNVANVLDDRDLYGLIYSAPLNARLTYGLRF